MPRRNLYLLVAAVVVAILCYERVDHNRYARVLANAMSMVENRHLEPVDAARLFHGAMRGMMEEIDDPHSSYIAPEDEETFSQALDPQFGGVGMEMRFDPATQQVVVAAPIYGAPAYQAGVRAGDRILRVDGHSAQGLSLEDMSHRLRGQPGEPVVVTVLHEGQPEPVDITIRRDVIHADTVRGDTRLPDGSWDYFLQGADRIGYLRIETFAETTADEMRHALQWLRQRGVRGVLIDLRDDHGGLLATAIEICDLFVPEGVIVSTRGRDKDDVQLVEHASRRAPYATLPLVVLVNGESASASEIVAACLQDHGRAKVVGQRTYGKGTVQELIALPDGDGILRLTTASYWRPSGKNINRRRDATPADTWGVMPDEGCEVTVEGEALQRLRAARYDRDATPAKAADKGDPPAENGARDRPAGPPPAAAADPQLARALEVLETEIGEPR